MFAELERAREDAASARAVLAQAMKIMTDDQIVQLRHVLRSWAREKRNERGDSG